MSIKNILVLSAVYPADDLPKEYTPVVHYFTREWVKMGYNVIVINYEVDFPWIMLKIANLFAKQLASHYGSISRTKPLKEREYVLDGVTVKRIMPMKYVVHGKIYPFEKKKVYEKTISYLEEKNFTPDVVISHWCNPQLDIMSAIKHKYNIPSCYVAHLPGDDILRIMKKDVAQKMIDDIDIIGFRSDYIKKEFLSKFSYTGNTFQCYSGVPDKFISKEDIKRDFSDLNTFIYVGTLIKRKYPALIIPAIKEAMDGEDFTISYIGEGAQQSVIESTIKNEGVQDKVHILGRVSRDEVSEKLKQHDFFVMISENETFGLVYLEAMAVGCITIASKKEGFDGIIQHGVNGFLCEAGNEHELSKLIKEIRKMPKSKLQEISNNAISTARELTESKVARFYIDNVEKLSNK